MNLVSGLEEVPGYFWAVSAGSVTWAVAVYVALAAYNSWPLRTYQRRLTDMTALQDVLAYNVDVIGEARTPRHATCTPWKGPAVRMCQCADKVGVRRCKRPRRWWSSCGWSTQRAR